MSDIEFTDRYQALGMAYPDPATMCHGQCEGMGVVPVRADDEELEYRERWTCAHNDAGDHECDGTHFVQCPDCNGTGKAASMWADLLANPTEEVEDV